MWVKICATTNLEDAMLAAELGADAVGFVFAASRRQVTAAQVAGITARLADDVERVGVFDSVDAEEIVEAVEQAGLTAVQLHGGLEAGLAERVSERLGGRVRVIEVLHWGANEGAADWVAGELERIAAEGAADRVLIDSKVGSASGGTGVAFDWEAARRVFASAPEGLRLIVAGGLRPENVAEAIARLAPWGVDVASGVEASPGRKDGERLRRFVGSARAARR